METLPLFPLSQALFPEGVLHLRIFEVRYLHMVRQCIEQETPFGVVALLSGREVRTPDGEETLASVGTFARIDTCESTMPTLLHVRCVGGSRFRVVSSRQQQYGLWVGQVEPFDNDAAMPVPPDLQGSADALGRLIAQMQQQGIPSAMMPIGRPYKLDECAWVADRWCELLPLPAGQKQALLALRDPLQRLRIVHKLLGAQGLL